MNEFFQGEEVISTLDINAYRDEIKRELTGGVLKLEITDSVIDSTILAAMREMQRYMDSTKLITIPYKPCLDLSEYKVNSVARVFRAQSYMSPDNATVTGQLADPMYLAMWQLMSGNGNLYNINDWTYNYASWNAALQSRNTISTDLLFRFERDTNNLYINCAFDRPELITIEYVPRIDNPEEIKSDFWIDVLMRLSKALVKQIVGRIRTRYNQSNALWSNDGERLLEEANTELTTLREQLRESTQLCYPVD